MKKKFGIKPPVDTDRILLHTCCAPCSSAIVESLLKNGIKPTVYYCNPNIFPREEYELRRSECVRYAESLGLEVVEAEYDHDQWLKYIQGLEDQPERGSRCLRCFQFRLENAMGYAQLNGFKVVSTTLASSRWKSLDQIDEAGHKAEEMAPDVRFWAQNWRKGGLSERRSEIIREMNFYNQTYCGCEFSMRKDIETNKDGNGAS